LCELEFNFETDELLFPFFVPLFNTITLSILYEIQGVTKIFIAKLLNIFKELEFNFEPGISEVMSIFLGMKDYIYRVRRAVVS